MRPVVIPAYTQKALRISESRYRRLFEAAQDGILLLNVVVDDLLTHSADFD